MGMTDTSGTPTIGRTVTPQWAGTSDGSWFNDKRDDASSFGTARWNSRRHFDWDSPAALDEKTDPMFDTGSVYSERSYFGGPDTPGSTAAYTDMATQRVQDALYGGLGQYGLGVMGVTGLRSAITGMSPADALTGAISSTLSPNVATSLMGNVLGAATGTQSGWVGNTVAGLASMANPVAGMMATALGPVVGEGIGKLTGTRKDENLKQAIENTLGSNFMGTAKITRDMRDMSNLAPSLQDSFVDSYGNLQTLDMSPTETQVNAQRSAAALAAGQVDARTAYNAQSLADYGALDMDNAALSRAAVDTAATSLYGSPVGAYQGVSPLSEMDQIQNYYALMQQPLQVGIPGTANAGTSLGLDVGYGDKFGSKLHEDSIDAPQASAIDAQEVADRAFAQEAGWGMSMTGRMGQFGEMDSDAVDLARASFSSNAGSIASSAGRGLSGVRTGGFTSRDASGLRGDLSSVGMAAADAGSHSTDGLGDGATSGSNSSSKSSGPDSGRGGHSAGPGGI